MDRVLDDVEQYVPNLMEDADNIREAFQAVLDQEKAK
jgi:hypothetical protein